MSQTIHQVLVVHVYTVVCDYYQQTILKTDGQYNL